MNLQERLQNVAVIGAGGKMGSGISLLLAREMTLQKLQSKNANANYQLTLMDVNPAALEGLQAYLKKQAARFAEKNAELIKTLFPGADEAKRSEMFVASLMSILHPVTDLAAVKNCRMIFEAILEKLELKITVFKQLKAANPRAYFFSNTSSIPIHELDEAVGLDGRMIGFHFYNPPAVQRLVELIIPEKVRPELPELSRALGKRLGKIIIPSNDVAGFIGNGHFTRDGLHGLSEARRLGETEGLSFSQAIYAVNRVTQDFLLRPMGIFQLIDYVGLDIFQSILNIMNPHFPDETLHSELIDAMVAKGVKGGQFSDGSQKDGFLKYENGKPAGVFDLTSEKYLAFDESDWKAKTDERLGPLPDNHLPWKSLLKDPERGAKLQQYFAALVQMDTPGAQLATAYLKRSKAIGEQLISSGVANSADDVNGVLMNGFFHLYGPVNDFV